MFKSSRFAKNDAAKTAFTQHRLTRSVSVICALLACYASDLYAQSQVEEIMVTGSRISRNIGFDSPVPITSMSTDELKLSDPGLGLSAQMENLPQFFNNVSSDNIANRVTADVGQSQLNMRGMGGNRTLVLLDGLRIVPSDKGSSVSVDYLPTNLIQRVDVVTGGASAAYGADALAGVTNFVLNRKFTGLDLSYNTGINETGDGEFFRVSATWGRDFMDKRLHLFGTVEERVNDGYRRDNADWDLRWGYVKNPAWVSATATPTVPQRLTVPYVYSNSFTSTGLILTSAVGGKNALNRLQFNEAGTGTLPFQEGQFSSIAGQAGTLTTAQGAPGQFQYDSFVQGHPESFERVGVAQQSGLLGWDFDVNTNLKLWGHALYGRTNDRPEPSSSGASGTGLGHAGLAFMTLFKDNPYLPQSVVQTMTAENRQSIRVDQHGFLGTAWGIQEHPKIVNRIGSLTVGFDANIGGDWSLRGSYQKGETQKHNDNYNWERLDRFYLATDAVADPVTGAPICRIQLVQKQLAAKGRNLEAELALWAKNNIRVFRSDAGATTPGVPEPVAFPIAVDSIDNTISGCVPVNMLGRGLQSKEAMDYIFSSRTKTGISTQKMDFAELVANGTLWKGWGAGAVTSAIGATFRKESIKQEIVDKAIDSLGAPCNVTLPDGTVVIRGIAPSISCSQTADNLHRFSGQPEFSGSFDVKELFTEANVPLFKTQSGKQSGELNLGARWSDYSQAGQFLSWKGGLSLKVSSDLRLRATLSNDIREGSAAELFVQQGRGATINDPKTGQTYTTFNLTGGNPNLKAEQARTTVVGFVYQPSYLEGLSISLDRYSADIKDAIGSFTEQQTVDECARSGALCEYITRGSDGLINTIRVQFININAAKVSGYDGEVSYRMEPNLFNNQKESLSLRLLTGYMDENSNTPLNSSKIDQADAFNLPKLTVSANLMYTVGDFGVNLQEVFSGSSLRNTQWVEGKDVDDNSVPSVRLTNLGLFWNGQTKGGSTWRASLNITNLFNSAPVIAGLTRVGDEVGRRYALGFTQNF